MDMYSHFLEYKPKSKQQISRWMALDWSSLPAGPPLHLVVPPIWGPKNTASKGPGEVFPLQLNLPALHGFELRGALKYMEKAIKDHN